MEQVGEELGRGLQRVAAAGNQEELDQGVQEYRQAVQDYQRESEAKELSRKRGFCRNASLCRLISMFMYFFFYLWLIYFVSCEVSHCTMRGSAFKILRIIAIVMLGLSTVIVLIESCFSHELEYLKNIMENETALGYIQRMQEVPPRINMVVECYHYETRTRVVHYTDSNGNRQSRTETYTETVVTFVDQDEFSFGSWVDVSKREMPALSTVALTRVKIDSSILFGDQETADDYERQVAEMVERNRHRDVFTAFAASKEIPGLKKRISAYVDLRVKPFWIRPLFFWIATLLQMTWPYRWLFRANTAKNYYTFKKKIFKSTTSPMEVDVMDAIAVLAGSASSVVNFSGSDNTCPGYPMSVMNNPETGNSAFQNGSTPYPPVNPYFEQGDLAHYISTPNPPQNPEGGLLDSPYPTVAQPNVSLPSYAAQMNNPAPDSSAAYPPLNPYAGAAFPPYSAESRPSAPYLHCHTKMVNETETQPNNET
ncbi:transmembrane protein 151B-like [Oculina patagonica]